MYGKSEVREQSGAWLSQTVKVHVYNCVQTGIPLKVKVSTINNSSGQQDTGTLPGKLQFISLPMVRDVAWHKGARAHLYGI